jgi:arylsulfate sulfotransferase
MMTSKLFLSISLGFILFGMLSCTKDESMGNVNSAPFREQLTEKYSRQVLITHIHSVSDEYTITFEDESECAMGRGVISRIEIDSLRWSAKFHFTDGGKAECQFVGSLEKLNASVALNPFKTSPLCALISIETPVRGRFRIKVHGKGAMGIPMENLFDHYGQSHALPILGLYEDYSNEVEIFFLNDHNRVRTSAVFTISTPLIASRPALNIQIIKPDNNKLTKGIFVISNLKIAFDSQGEIRWFHNGDGVSFFSRLANGNFIANERSNKSFYEITMVGETVKKYNVSSSLHHEIQQMPGGNFLVASNSLNGTTIEDAVVEVSRETGEIIRTWDFNKLLDPGRPGLPDSKSGDWLHINALCYDSTDRSIVISGRNQSAVVKIDYASGKLKWILSHPRYWPDSLQRFLLKPVGASGNLIDASHMDFWSYGQHAVRRNSNGNFMLYDNGIYRGFYDDAHVKMENYSRGVEYKIDEANRTVALAWSFDNGKSVFTPVTGFAQEISDSDSRLLAYAFISDKTPRIIEVGAQNSILFEATVNRSASAYYRIMKMNLYDSID